MEVTSAFPSLDLTENEADTECGVCHVFSAPVSMFCVSSIGQDKLMIDRHGTMFCSATMESNCTALIYYLILGFWILIWMKFFG